MIRNLKQKPWGFMALALVVAAGIAAFTLTAQADPGHDGPGKQKNYGGHHGPGGGMGSGMGAGAGKHGMGFMPGLMAKLSPDKREQVRQIHTGLQRRMIEKGAAMKILRLDMRELMRAYPLDQSAVMGMMEEIQKLRKAMFSLRIGAMAKAQQVAGKELWQEAHTGMMSGMEHGSGGDHGPGKRWGGGRGHGSGMAPDGKHTQ